MRKKYNEPIIEITNLINTDVITTSTNTLGSYIAGDSEINIGDIE